MKSIALVSDNHSYHGSDLFPFLEGVDEIWHAGDLGDLKAVEKFQKGFKFIGVYGNIDDNNTRLTFPENQIFSCESVKVLMTHIGGYPGNYYPRVKKLLLETKPDLFISGHSHICKIMPDSHHKLLHMNPGSYGHHGFHFMRTFIKFKIEEAKILDVNVIELGKRGAIK